MTYIIKHEGEIIKNKIKRVLSKDPDIKKILKIAEILDGNETTKHNLPAKLISGNCVGIF